MEPLSHCVFVFVCLRVRRPESLLGGPLIVKMVRVHVVSGGALT